MKVTITKFTFIGLLLLLAACNTAEQENASTETQATVVSPTTSGESENGRSRMGMMGMGNGMMARHHATIPEEYAGLTNPGIADADSLTRGAEIYAAQCASCHGDGGMGDGPAAEGLDPAPAPIAHSSQMLGNDYLYWRISEGGQMEPFNSTMIAWKGVLDEQARWDVINYIQALGSGAVTPGEHLGGAAYDPDAELVQRAEMLANAVAQEIITQAEADTFSLVHIEIDAHVADMGDQRMGGMDAILNSMLAALVNEGKISQEQAYSFQDVHDRLDMAGLMQ